MARGKYDFGFCRWKPAPRYWYWFTRMQWRAITREMIPCEYPFTLEGYDRFEAAIGPIPIGMKYPTVGRIDHTKGYFRGNFRWQEKSENSSEAARRNKLSARGKPYSNRSPRHNSRQTVVCPHCGYSGKLPPMRRWHFDNCQPSRAENRRE